MISLKQKKLIIKLANQSKHQSNAFRKKYAAHGVWTIHGARLMSDNAVLKGLNCMPIMSVVLRATYKIFFVTHATYSEEVSVNDRNTVAKFCMYFDIE